MKDLNFRDLKLQTGSYETLRLSGGADAVSHSVAIYRSFLDHRAATRAIWVYPSPGITRKNAADALKRPCEMATQVVL